MKDAILGTYHHSTVEDARTLLRTALQTDLQRKAGYIPARLPADIPFLPPIHATFAEPLRPLIRTLCKNRSLRDGSARAPYLIMAWMLIGQDYPFCALHFASDKTVVVQVAGLLIGIALGDFPDLEHIATVCSAASQIQNAGDRELFRHLRMVRNPRERELLEQPAWAHKMALHAATILHLKRKYLNSPVPRGVRKAVKRMVHMAYALGDTQQEIIHDRAKTWRTMDDEQAWQLANKLMLDLLKLHGKAL
jgi:hypothetical protein